MCVKILRQFADKAGIKSNFSIYSETERSNVIKKAFAELDFDDEKLLKNAKYHIGNANFVGEGDCKDFRETCFFFPQYVSYARSQNTGFAAACSREDEV